MRSEPYRTSGSPWRSVSLLCAPFCSLVVLWKQWMFKIANDPWRDYDSVIVWYIQLASQLLACRCDGRGERNRNELRLGPMVPVVVWKACSLYKKITIKIRTVWVLRVCCSRIQTGRMVLLFPLFQGLSPSEISANRYQSILHILIIHFVFRLSQLDIILF